MANDIIIHVHAKNETKGGLDKAKADAERAGDQSGQGFMSRFASAMLPSKVQLITAGIISGLAALPALMAVGGVLAGAALGAAVLIGTKNSQGPLYAQFHAMLSGLMGVIRSAVQPLEAPLRQMFASIGSFAKSIGPELRQVFAAIGPALAPFTAGLEGLIRGLLPGFLALMRMAQPAMLVFGQLLSGLGRDLGTMFSVMAPAVKASSDVLRMLGTVINGLMPTIGRLAAMFAAVLGPVLQSFGSAIASVMPAVVMIGTVLGRLGGAILGSLSGALRAVAQLVQAMAPGFATLARVLGQVFHAMENSGVFNLFEDALEKLAGPLGRIVGMLLSGLAPVLGLIAGAAMRTASMLTGMLGRAITELMPGLAAIVKTLMQFLVTALTPLIPAILKMNMAMMQMLGALLPILPPVLKLVNALLQLAVQVLTPLIPLLVLAAQGQVKFFTQTEQIVAWVVKVISAIANWAASLVSFVSGLQGAGEQIAGVFNNVQAGVISMIGKVITWFDELPGRILSAIAGLDADLFSAGARVIGSLVSGMESMLGSVASTIGKIAGEITSHLPFSPAKKGPLSGAGDPRLAGQRIARYLAQGMSDRLGDVSAAAGRVAGAASAGAGIGGGGAGGFQVVLRFDGSEHPVIQALMQGLRVEIRGVGGGGPNSVQRALGQTWATA